MVGPFTLTLTLTLIVTLYMVLGPAKWLKKLMQLTSMSFDFEILLICFGFVFLALSWTYERYISARLARLIWTMRQWTTGAKKQRKEYKTILESLRA